MKTKIIVAMIFAAVLGTNEVIAETIKNVQYRVENMRCGGCARRVKKALTAKEGVSEVTVDLEKKVITISYDADKITTDALASTITEAKFTPIAYSKTDVIERSASFKAVQMHCDGCAKRVKANLSKIEGVKAVDVDLKTKSVKITYDANKISRDIFKDEFKKFDYTVTTYMPNKVIDYLQVTVTGGTLNADGLENLSKVKGFVDVNMNEKTKTIAIAFNTKVMDATGVKAQLKSLNYVLAD